MGARKGSKIQVRKDFNEDQLGAQLCDTLQGIQRQRSGCLIGAMRLICNKLLAASQAQS